MEFLKEGGNIFQGTSDFDHKLIPDMMKQINSVAKQTGAKVLPIGSGATPTPGKISGDLDMIVDAGVLKKYFKIDPADKKANTLVKVELENLFKAAGFETRKSGQIVHVKTNVGDSAQQVDIMVVDDGETAQKFHVHDIPKGSPYKGVHKQMLIADLSKTTTTAEHPDGFKWSPYKGLVDRTTDELVSNNLDEVAKILLTPKAKAADLGSVEAIVAAKPEAQAIVDKYESDERPDSSWKKSKVAVATEATGYKTLEDKQLARIKELSGSLLNSVVMSSGSFIK
tara:strand:+ start:896 stop:1744 length:849 start_codon:yes stop_codon:yes gene_type:complete